MASRPLYGLFDQSSELRVGGSNPFVRANSLPKTHPRHRVFWGREAFDLHRPACPRRSPRFGRPPRPGFAPACGDPFKASGIYKIGERVGWNVAFAGGITGGSTAFPRYAFSLRRNNEVVLKSGELPADGSATTIETTLAEPAMLYLELTTRNGRPLAYGAAVAPTDLRPVAPRPKDFDAFWAAKIAALRQIPANPVLSPADSGKPGVAYATVRMDHVDGTRVYGQIAKPAKVGKYPAVLVLLWAGSPYPVQKPWVTDLAAQGWLALNTEPHDVLPNESPTYYQNLPERLRNYHNVGQDDRDECYFVEMYLRGVRAVDYLAKHPEWDGKTLLVMGTSMGGQQSLAVAGLHPKVTHLIVNVPAGCDLNAGLHGRQPGYPNFTKDNPKAMETARYVDCVNFASRIRATSLVAMGFVDTVTPPAGIWTAFNLIKGPKEVAPMPESPHNHLATPEQQRPYTRRAAEWMDALVHGRKVEVRKG
ncbi:MAG: acetylxylan esterase [Fimbriimonadaceae bacterium]|nr:acetylxylan esterase [Fimbriimonadaceae bacterium]